MDNRNDIDFIARRYKEGRFNTTDGWRRLGIAPSSIWRRFRVAAATAAVVALSAAAALYYTGHTARDLEPQHIESAAPEALTTVKVIDFENAPLPEVVSRIEEIYNVKVDNLPDDAATYSLSLHYEGNPKDLIGVINDILGTHMTVSER
ncbi:MAG: DUF4974 domain-containing protein [Duncaniella sp.]|nr:DUF4974 domain-containing protein [Duncaniella sp.]